MKSLFDLKSKQNKQKKTKLNFFVDLIGSNWNNWPICVSEKNCLNTTLWSRMIVRLDSTWKMALRLFRNQLNLNSKQIIQFSRYVSKDVSKDVQADVESVPVKHKEVVYEDGPVKIVEKMTHTKQVMYLRFVWCGILQKNS